MAIPAPSAKQLRAARKQAERLAAASIPAAKAAPPVIAAPMTATAPPPVPTPATAPSAATSVATVEREVELSLDGLKDRLFRLELRRQAGTISEEDYARERSHTEQVLRELVRG